jgi:hypothetical protein
VKTIDHDATLDNYGHLPADHLAELWTETLALTKRYEDIDSYPGWAARCDIPELAEAVVVLHATVTRLQAV